MTKLTLSVLNCHLPQFMWLPKLTVTVWQEWWGLARRSWLRASAESERSHISLSQIRIVWCGSGEGTRLRCLYAAFPLVCAEVLLRAKVGHLLERAPFQLLLRALHRAPRHAPAAGLQQVAKRRRHVDVVEVVRVCVDHFA